MTFKHKQLSDRLYSVVDGKRDYAIFRLIEARIHPPFCKQLELNIHQEVMDEVMQEGNLALLLRIYRFVFHSALEITHEKKGIQLCKLYSRGEMAILVYRKFAAELNRDQYDVKWYGAWIEIRKKSPKKS